MFVRYFVELPLTSEQTEKSLLNDPEDWIPGMASSAENVGAQLLSEVGIGSEHRRVARQVVIELREPIRFPSRLIVPMTWKATGRQALFPVFEADIEIAPLGSGRTQLSVSARYDPPLGAIGRAMDRALLHRVAEAVVKDFLDRVGERLRAVPQEEPGMTGESSASVTP